MRPWNKGLTKETDVRLAEMSRKISAILTGKKHSEETKKKMSKSHIGLSTKWLKGRKLSEEHKRKIGQGVRRAIISGKLDYNKIAEKTRGLKRTEETKAKMSKARTGLTLSKEWREKISIAHNGKKFSLEHKENIRKAIKEFFKKLSPKELIEWAKHGLTYRRPTSFEKRFLELINKYVLPFKYVGNGKLWINGRNPDFVSFDGNTVVETYYTFWKPANYEEERKKIFSEKTVIFLNENNLFGDGWEERCLELIQNRAK